LYGYHGSAVDRCDRILMRPPHSLSRQDGEGLTTTLCSIDDYSIAESTVLVVGKKLRQIGQELALGVSPCG
jgi:hypothetical protein